MASTKRVLRPQTIIPDNLYVKRAADRQLDQILDDMGRPGYVLVARQMGKTNLLLNMKRRREASGDIVIYVDLSERFESARACFRYIIDLALETHENHFGSLVKDVESERKEMAAEPSLEYGRHLRKLLRASPDSRMIIVLDEVDSLVNANYSDAVLAQVRSTYFTRSNFSDYDRLTYVLSGVAEPSDLIKDKNISPFNIGEKIYLDDFSMDEFREFIKKVGLEIRPTTADRVYWWTGGNPRMTWDVCAALEELEKPANATSSSDVDSVVENLYLKNYDRAPIDHMRVLVAGEPQLRNALMSIRYGKGATIDEKTRVRLYLAGITSSQSNSPVIKSPIIDAALSDVWLAQATADSDLLLLASEHFAGNRFSLVKDTIYRHREKAGSKLPNNISVQLGIALYYLGEFAEVIIEFASVLPELKGEVRTTGLYFQGSSYFLTNAVDESLIALEEAARGTGDYKLPAQILLAAAYYRAGVAPSDARILTLRDAIIAALRARVDDGGRERFEVLPSSLYDISIEAISAGDRESAIEYLDLALEIAPSEIKPRILLTRYSVTEPSDSRRALVLQAGDLIVAEALQISDASRLGLGRHTLAALICSLVEEKETAAAAELMRDLPRLHQSTKSGLSLFLAMMSLFTESNVSGLKGAMYLAEEVFPVAGATGHELLQLRRMQINFEGDVLANEGTVAKFINALSKLSPDQNIGAEEALLIINIAQRFYVENQDSRALELINIAKIPFEGGGFWLLILLLTEMNIHARANDAVKARSVASEVVRLGEEREIDENESAELSNAIKNILGQARTTLERDFPGELDPYRHVGRNQKVVIADAGGGEGRVVKFKLVQQGVKTGKYKIIRVLPR